MMSPSTTRITRTTCIPRIAAYALALILLLGVTAGHAQNSWRTNTGSWSVAGNWSSNIVPTNTSTAYIDNGGTSVLNANGSVGTLTIASTNSSSGNLVITNGGALTVSSNLIVGNAGSGSVTVSSGGTLTASNITIASQSNSTGTLNVGTYGGNDTNVTLNAQAINFGSGTGTVNFNQADTLVVSSTFNGTNRTSASKLIAQLGAGTTVMTGQQLGTNKLALVVNGGALVFSNAVYTSTYGVFGEAGLIYVGYRKSGSAFSNSMPVSMLITSNSVVSAYQVEIGYGNNGGVPNGNAGNSLVVDGSTLKSDYFYVGDGGDSNTLLLTNGAIVTISGSPKIGSTGNGNRAIVTGTNTIWSAGSMYLGYSGNSTNTSGQLVGLSNSLVISNGAKVLLSSGLYVGYRSGTNGSNTVLVTGMNSTLSNGGGMYLGYSENGDTVTVSDGAKLYGSNDYIGYNGGSSNSMLVTGAGSTYTNSGFLQIGSSNSAGNSLVISNGAKVLLSGALSVGYDTGINGNNTVLVTGANSTLSNGGGMNLGYWENGDTVTVSDGAKLIGSNDYIGYATASNNTMLVTGPGSIYTNSGDLGIGDDGSGNSLVVSNGATVAVNGNITVSVSDGNTNNSVTIASGGTLTVGGNGSIGGFGASNNTITVNGQGSALQITGDLSVGNTNGEANSLNLNNGALVSASSISAYSNNILSGNGTITTTGGTTLNGGSFAPTGTNALTVNGNLTFTNSAIYVWNLYNNSTSATGGTNFTVTSILNNGLLAVSGSTFNVVFGTNVSSGLFWSNSQSWTIMTGVANGAGTNFTLGFLGNTNGITQNRFSLVNSSGNLSLVYTVPIMPAYWQTNTQPWTNGSNWTSLIVPTNSTAAYIDNGGTSVLNTNGSVGTLTIASTNSSSGNLVITNGGALTVSSNLIVGNASSGSVTVSSGGTLISSNITIASQSNSTGTLNVGTYGGTDTNVRLGAPTITFGSGTGTVNFNQADTLVVSSTFNGTNRTSAYKLIAQLGAGTTVMTGQQLGTNKLALVVNGGALVFSNAVYTSTYGRFIEDGLIYVGYRKSGSAFSNSMPVNMLITSNSVVSAYQVEIGYGNNGGVPNGNAGNSLVVDGSTLKSDYFYVGDGGDSNTLLLTNGAIVTISGSPKIGSTGNGNRAIVTGTNTIWSAGSMYLGYSGNSTNTSGQLVGLSNSLVISNGAKVLLSGAFYVGYDSGTNGNNTVLVTGRNSTLSNGGGMYLGYSENGDTVTVSDGAKLYGSNDYIGYNGSSNSMLVTGVGSIYTNSGFLQIGSNGSGNSLNVSNGAVVSASSIKAYSNSVLTGNGTITTTGGTTLNGGTFAPTGTNALTVNGNLTFTNSAVYLWNLFANSTNNPSSGINYTVPVVLNGDLAVDTNSTFGLNFGGSVDKSNPFWTNSQQWLVMSGTNALSSGANFNLAWATPTSGAGFNLSLFGISESNNNLYLNYSAPLVTNPTVNPGSTNYLPSYSSSATELIIAAPTNGTAVLAASNPTLVGIILNSGTLASTNQTSIPTNASVTVNNGTMGFTGPGTNTIGSLFVSGGSVAASNTIVNVQSFVQTGGTLSGGTNATYWADNYYFAATNPALVAAALDNLGTVAGYHSTATVTTNESGAPVAPVVFDNNMSYDGGTVITGGILQLGSSNSSGAVSVQGIITNNGFLNYGYNGNSTTPTNTVIGSGVIGQVGSGTLTVGTGITSSFTGSFAAANGTLAVTNANTLGSSTNFYLASSGTLRVATGVTNITQSVNVTNGTGIIDNASGGTLVLDGTLTKSGSVLVLAGGNFDVNAQVTGSGAPGSFDSDLVVSNATVTLNSGNNNYTGPTYVIAGSTLYNGINDALPTNTVLTLGALSDGAVTNTYDLNPNNQTIAALASAGGATNIVQASTQGIQTLTINGSQNTVYSGLIQGQLALVRSGVGSTLLTGANTYSGGTTISSGRLITQNVQALGSGAVALNGGTLEVRSTLNIASLNWTGGQIALPNAGSGQYVMVTGAGTPFTNTGVNTFNLTGASLTAGTPTALLGATNITSYSTNDFSVTGVEGYSLLMSNNILWIYLLNDPAPSSPVYPDFVQYAINRNQTNVATALNSFTNHPNADQTVVLNSLVALTNSPAQMQQAFNAIMPNFYQQIATIAFNNANAQNMELNQRLWGLRLAEGGGFSMSGLADNFAMLEGQGDGAGAGKGVLDSKKDILRPGLDNHWGMFVDGNGIFAQANSANMLPGYKSQSGGITTGLTYKWNDNFASGIYCGYQGTFNKSGAAGSGLGVGSTLIDNAVRFGVFGTYGSKDGKGLYANALAGGGYHNFQASRVIQYTGVNRTANSAPGAGELDTMLATGYDIQKGKFTFGPTASLQYTYLGVNSLNETGAQSLNFNSGGWNSSSMLSSVGAHAAYNWQAGKNVLVVPQVSLNWQHEFMQNPYAIGGNLGGTSPDFSNWSAAPIRDFLYTGVGFTVELNKKWNTSFFYNAAAGNNDLVSQNIFWSAGMKF